MKSISAFLSQLSTVLANACRHHGASITPRQSCEHTLGDFFGGPQFPNGTAASAVLPSFIHWARPSANGACALA